MKLSSSGAGLDDAEPDRIGSPDAAGAESGGIFSIPGLHCVASGLAWLTTDKDPVWLAVYKTEIAKDAIVSYSDGVVMSYFHRKSLNRTFDTIIFVDRLLMRPDYV